MAAYAIIIKAKIRSHRFTNSAQAYLNCLEIVLNLNSREAAGGSILAIRHRRKIQGIQLIQELHTYELKLSNLMREKMVN
jgi:hypothetical protein